MMLWYGRYAPVYVVARERRRKRENNDAGREWQDAGNFRGR
jgi:hypothetical protein